MNGPATAKRNAGHTLSARLIVAMLIGALFVLADSEADARSYRVSEIRAKVAQGNWDVQPGDTLSITRQESYGGQWALEYCALKGGQVMAQLLDSSNAAVWEGEIGDLPLLSSRAPAFAVASRFDFNQQVYNMGVSRDPVYEIESSVSTRAYPSRDGTAFGMVAGRESIKPVTIEGKTLGLVRVESPARIGAVALSVEGKYVALGAKGRRARAAGGGWKQQVALYDSKGGLLTNIDIDAQGDIPRCLALSGDDPPRIAVGTNRGVSYWSPEGEAIWSDSTAFILPRGKRSVAAMYVTDDGHVLALTTTGATDATLWAWDSQGKLETPLELPAEFDATSDGAEFIGATDSSVTIQTQGEVLTVVWSDE